MAQDFKRAVFRTTGLIVNPHLMRHLTGKLAVDNDPALIVAVSQRLGHTTIETTQDAYLPNGSLPASRTMNKLLEEKLLNAPKRRKRPKKSRKE